MKKLIYLLCALFASSQAYAAADATAVGTRGATTGSTCSTTAGSVSAGDTIVGVVSFDSTATITVNTLSGSGSDAFGAATAAVTTASEGKISAFVVQNATGGASVTWSLTFSGTAYPVCHLIKLTGVTTASLDAASLVTSTTDNASPWTVTSNTFAQANNIVLAGIEQGCGVDGTWASSNFTVVSSEGSLNYWPSAVVKLRVTSTSAVTPSFTHTGSTSCVAPMFVLGFKEAAGSPPTLSSATPSGTLGTSTTATLGATTNVTSGTFYAVVDPSGSITGITASQVKAAQDNGGGAVVASCNAAVSTTTPSCGVTGLSPSTTYGYAVVHNSTDGDSNVLTGTFTTAAGGGGATQPPRSMHYKRLMGQRAANDNEFNVRAIR